MFWEEEIYQRYWEKKPHADTWWIAAKRPVSGIRHQMIFGRRKHVSLEYNISGSEAKVTGHCTNVQMDHSVISTYFVVRICHTTSLNVWGLSFGENYFYRHSFFYNVKKMSSYKSLCCLCVSVHCKFILDYQFLLNFVLNPKSYRRVSYKVH